MAMIGDGAAIAEMGAHHHELHGHVAFAAWLGVHAWLMSGVRQRVDAFVSWGWDFLGSSRSSSIIDDPDAARIDWGDERRADGDTMEARDRALRRHHHRQRRRRRHARPHPRRLRQADPAARAGQLPAPGDGQLGPRAGVHRRQVHLQGHLVRRRRQAVPAAGPLQRRRRHQALRRRAVPAAPAGLRRDPPRRRPLAGVAADLRRLRAVVLARPSGSTRCTATPARTPPKGHRSQAVPVAGGVARAADPAALRRARGRRLPPVPRPVRHPARRGRPGQEHVHPLHVVRRLPVPGPRQGRRRDDRRAPAARPAERDAARRRRGDPARDRRRRPHRHRRRRVPRRQHRGRTTATSSSCRPGRRTRPSCCCARPTTATRTAWPTARTRSGGTTCSTTARPSSPWPRSPTTPSSRRRSGSTTSTSARPTTTGRPATSR